MGKAWASIYSNHARTHKWISSLVTPRGTPDDAHFPRNQKVRCWTTTVYVYVGRRRHLSDDMRSSHGLFTSDTSLTIKRVAFLLCGHWGTGQPSQVSTKKETTHKMFGYLLSTTNDDDARRSVGGGRHVRMVRI